MKKIKRFFPWLWGWINYLCFKPDGNQTKGFTLVVSLFVPILFAYWGIKLTYRSLDNTENIDILNKIFLTLDTANQNAKNLKELPKTFADLNLVLKKLSEEGKKLSGTYNSADSINNILIQQQELYVDKLIKLTASTNSVMSEVAKAHKAMDKEYSRKPKIEFSCSVKEVAGKYYVQAVNIFNGGAIECDIKSLLIEFSDSYVCPDSIYKPMEFFRPEFNKLAYKLDMSTVEGDNTIGAGRTKIIKTYHTCYFPSKNIIAGYNLAYHSKYIDTTIIGVFNKINWNK